MITVTTKRVCAGVLAIAAISLLTLSFTNIRQAVVKRPYRADFDVYYFAAVAEHHGAYADTPRLLRLAGHAHRGVAPEGVYGAPALVAIVFMPLTVLPVHAAELLWDVAMAVLTFLAVRNAARAWWPLFLCALALTSSFLSGAEYANPSILTFALIAFAYGALRDGHDRRAGILIGAATAAKLYPGFLVIALLAGRKWSAIKWAAISAAVLTLMAVPILGPSDFIKDMDRLLSWGGINRIWGDNDSFPGIAAWTTGSLTLARAVNIAGLVLASALVVVWSRNRAAQTTFALTAGLMLLSQSLTWGHYYTLAILLLVVIFTSRPSLVTATYATFGYALTALPAFTFGGQPFWWAPGLDKVAGLLTLLVCCVVATRRPESVSEREIAPDEMQSEAALP